MRCKYCGAILRRDAVGLYCPTKNCQWQYGSDEADEADKDDAAADAAEGGENE